MANLQGMQVVITWADIQAATVGVKVMREADPTTEPHIRRNSIKEPHRPR